MYIQKHVSSLNLHLTTILTQVTSIRGQINRKLFISIELKSPVEQNTYIAQEYTFLQKKEHTTTHINITPAFLFAGQTIFYVKCTQAIYQRVFYLLILTSKKANYKENGRYTAKVINRKKKYIDYASREVDFRNNFIFSVISAISQKPSSSHRQVTSILVGYSEVPLPKKYSCIT